MRVTVDAVAEKSRIAGLENFGDIRRVVSGRQDQLLLTRRRGCEPVVGANGHGPNAHCNPD